MTKFYNFLFEGLSKMKWKQAINQNPELRAAVKILHEINQKGYAANIVGGAVRDILLGINPKDVDISTNCPMEILEKMYDNFDIGKNKDFGIIVVKKDGYHYEISNYRNDKYEKIPLKVRKIL